MQEVKGEWELAVIASKACLRSGCGLLTVAIPFSERFIVQTTLPEAMLIDRNKAIDLSNYSAIGIGPAIGLEVNSTEILKSIISSGSITLVIDADALTILSNNPELFSKLTSKTILTPHPKEFDRLFGIHHSREEQIETAIAKAKEFDLIIVLKGSQTVITNGTETYYNTTGNSGLAKGGSGDALTGMITSFLAQGYLPFQASILSVYLHGLAADITLKSQSEESMLITDLIESLGEGFKAIS
ncbi:NAD(P)H-hydrate dehydratase [Crocinitomicaceae bacterium]|nr:NAD(P)H-hydrate dehydratase [Crocinitomicaceae bacterium]